MNKAVPWNISGVGFDARDAARDAARRQGKSLGEWLHEVIADHASERGLEERDIAGQDRIDAVTAKLERLSTRSTEFEQRINHDGYTPKHRSQGGREERDERDIYAGEKVRDRNAEPSTATSRRATRAPLIEETEFLLEEAIDAMERRAKRSERRTDDALASFAKLLEANEARRDGERDAVTTLAQKLGDIESKLTDRLAANDQSPIKGALARLEARLDMISRRSNAEATAKQSTLSPSESSPPERGEPLRRLEEKLNTILDAVSTRPQPSQTSSIAVAAAQQSPASPHRRLGEAIAAISQRQRDLDEPSLPPSNLFGSLRRRPAVEDLRRQLQPRNEPPLLSKGDDALPSQAFVAMQAEIASLAAKIEGMRGDLVQRRTTRTEKPAELESLRFEVAAMSQSLRDLAPRDATNAIEAAIKTLSARVETSRDRGVHDAILRPLESVVADLRHALADMDPRKTIGALEQELHSVAGKIDRLAETRVEPSSVSKLHDQVSEIRDLLTREAKRPHAQEAFGDQITSLVEALDWKDGRPGFERHLIATVERLRDMVAQAPGTEALEKIESRLEALTGKIDIALDQAARAKSIAADTVDTASLEQLVRDLSRKIEAVQTPESDNRAIDALQQQIVLLSRRFETSEHGLAKLATLEHSMRDLFDHLETTRASVETSAAHAAREVLRIAADEGRGRGERPVSHDVAALQAMQDEADARTQSTLSAVHEALVTIVDRLSVMEGDIAEVRGRDKAKPGEPHKRIIPGPVAERTQRNRFDLGVADPLSEPVFKSERAGKIKREDQPKFEPARGEDMGRSDFIAAARRAANAAQHDPSITAFKRPAAPSPKGGASQKDEGRAGLIVKSRDYVASHKRPVLLSIGALFVILGTVAIMQRTSFGTNGSLMAERRPPAGISRVAESASRFEAPVSGPSSRDAFSQSMLPKSSPSSSRAIQGSDPVQTASIPALPAFVAQGAAAPAPEVPAALKSMAESGNSAAQFELGSRFAEGKGVPRDIKQAAKWYEKAAEQGSAPAQYRLASLYEKGLGVAKDKSLAKSLYIKAAEAGNPRAMHNLAVLLADGDGKPDYEGASTWFRKAAQYGVHDSQYNLAILLARGMGVQQSLVQSYQWFAIAALDNDSDAARKRDEVGDKLSGNDLAVAKALAASFHARRADATAVEVQAPPGGWDSAPASSHLNIGKSKVSSL